jgi:hypothetical protein
MSPAPAAAVALLLLCAPALASAKVTQLPADARAILHRPDQFQEVRAKAKLPASILELLGGDAQIADPGQPWQVTDVVESPPRPWQRLDWAAVAGDLYLVHYEHGGIGHSFELVLARWKKGDARAQVLWHGYAKKTLAGLRAFLAALDGGTLGDAPLDRL